MCSVFSVSSRPDVPYYMCSALQCSAGEALCGSNHIQQLSASIYRSRMVGIEERGERGKKEQKRKDTCHKTAHEAIFCWCTGRYLEAYGEVSFFSRAFLLVENRSKAHIARTHARTYLRSLARSLACYLETNALLCLQQLPTNE